MNKLWAKLGNLGIYKKKSNKKIEFQAILSYILEDNYSIF